MANQFLDELGYLSYTMRLKRLSDNIMHSGRRLYQDLQLDIEPNWFLVFKLLQKHGAMTVTEMAECIELSHPSMVAIIQQMNKKGFVTSSKDKNDSRKRVLSLTEKSKRQLPVYQKIWSSGSAAMSEALEESQAMDHLQRLESIFSQKDFRYRVLKDLARDVKIQASSKSELKDFERLNLEWLKKFFYVEDYDRKVLGDPEHYILNKGGHIFNATLMDQVVGTVSLIQRGEGIFELSKMAVTEKFQGLKIGEKLMKFCIDFSKAQGAHTLFLDSNTILNPAITLYRKMGFVEIPVPEDTPYERCNIRMEIKFQKEEDIAGL